MRSAEPQAPIHRARKRYGQHFLERAWVDKVVQAIKPTPGAALVEIGAGRGALTVPLAARVRRLLAIEIDRDLVEHLKRSMPGGVTVLGADVLDVGTADMAAALGEIPEDGIRVVGNLPYNVASLILFHLVALYESGSPIRDATLMVQREVADRIVARPGSRDYGVLSVQLQHVAACERLLTLPPGAFRPPPKVESALLRLRFHPPLPSVTNLPAMRAMVRLVFARRRKTLANALAAALDLSRPAAEAMIAGVGIDSRRRPETLALAEFCELANALEATQ